MRGSERTAKRTGRADTGNTVVPEALVVRHTMVAAAGRVLWNRLRGRARLSGPRSLLRRRLANYLRGCAAGQVLEILRSTALAGAIAASLLAPGSARAQVVELSRIARGEGGFLMRGEGEPASGVGLSVADAGDVDGDGMPDLIVGGRWCAHPYHCYVTPTYVVFGKPDGTVVELSEVRAGMGGFPIGISGSSVSGAGDVNGDGLADVIVGAPLANSGGRDRTGET